MSRPLVVDGSWPGKLTVTRGWARVEARPWNTESDSAHLRLLRGNASFLTEATELVGEKCDGTIYSPAMYPVSTRVWRRAGYQHHSYLLVMERGLMVPFAEPSRAIDHVTTQQWERLLELDHSAFGGFWGMDRAGIEESLAATPHHVVLGHSIDDTLVGYAIVGMSGTTSFLQRIAVDPVHSNQGLGADLVLASFAWAADRGGISMLLNTREDNATALHLYQRLGFSLSDLQLEILRHQIVLN